MAPDAASAISETGAELGGALGIAVLGSIGTAVYRSEMADAVPADAPAHVAEAARDTLRGAVGAADQLPASLLDAAGVAFTQGFQLAAGLSAAIVVGVALLAAFLLREPPADGAPEEAVDSAAARVPCPPAGIVPQESAA